MKKLLIFYALAIFSFVAKSQVAFPTPYVIPNTDWVKYFSQKSTLVGSPLSLDYNSSVYTTGYYGTTSAADMIVLKYDSTGVQTYSFSYNNGGYDCGKALKVDGSGNAYVAGVSYTSTTLNDFYVVKLSPTGSVLWQKRYDKSHFNDEPNDITLDASGNAVVTGKSQNIHGDYDIWTLKLNASTGAILWQNTYAGSSALDDIGIGTVVSSNSSTVYVTGNTGNSSTGSDIVTFALNASSGATITGWPTITNGSANTNDYSHGIIRCGANITICGELSNTSTGIDYTTIKYNGSTGAIKWQKQYDFGSSTNKATALAKDSAGHIGVIGTVLNGSTIEYHTVLYDTLGNLYATNIESTGLSALGADPRICNDTIAHHWYVSGEKSRLSKDIFVYQITPTGNTSWRQYIDGQNLDSDVGTAIGVNGVGVVYVGGQSKNSSAAYDYTTIKINQTPCYWPPDFAAEGVNRQHLYLKNSGQVMKSNLTAAPEALFYTHNTNPSVFIEQGGFDFVFNHTDTILSTIDTLEKVQCQFVGSSPFASLHEYLPTGTKYNYMLGYATATNVVGVQGNQRILIPNYYPYIDLHYFSDKNGIKYYLVVKPGATIGKLSFQINGATTSTIDGTTGNLKIAANLGNIEFNKPLAYTTNTAGAVVTLTGSASWILTGTNKYSIQPPTYTSTVPLIIEVSTYKSALAPTGTAANLDYSTYYGGTSSEQFNDVWACPNGDRYIAGQANSAFFPVVNSSNNYSGNNDAVFLKYTADDTLRYATYQGGSSSDIANSVAVNSLGEVFIGGISYSTDMLGYNVTGATNQFNNGGASSPYKADGFIAKFVGNNNALTWRRYFGGSGSETVNSLFIDGSDNLYVAGYSSSFDFPVVNAFKATLGATTTANPSNTDAIFGKFNSSLVAQWITYYGGSANAGGGGSFTADWGLDITVDNSGRVIGCGLTDATNIATVNSTGNPNTFFDNSESGVTDGFLVRYSSAGTPDFSSYFGGAGDDNITRLKYNSTLDEIYFAGESKPGAGFPFFTKAGAFNSTYAPSGARTAFVGYMDGSLTKKWNTYYGHGQSSTINYQTTGLSVDNSGLVYLSGYTTSDSLNYPTTFPTGTYFDNTRSAEDGYMAIFTPAKALYDAHYFGGIGNDRILNTDVSQNQRIYVTGLTASNNFPIAYTPITAALIDSTFNGATDGFISRFTLANYQVSGVEQFEFDNNTLTVYPNPANTGFNLEMTQELKGKPMLKVYTIIGQLVYEKEITEKTTQIVCESWTNGVYLLNVSNNQTQRTFKLIKQ